MKTWKIPVYWGMIGIVNVEANTLNEAIKIAQDDKGIIQRTVTIDDDGIMEIFADKLHTTDKVIVINKSGFTIPNKNGFIKWFYHSN